MHKLSHELRIELRKKIIKNVKHNIAALLTENYELKFVEPNNKEFFVLEELQTIVGGLIEVYPEKVVEDSVTFVDEEGLLKDRKPNQLIKDVFGIDVVGNAFIVPNNLLHED